MSADQRYCLTCGKPCSPARLAFLDVLRAEHGQGGLAAAPAGAVLAPGVPGLPAGPAAGGSVVYMPPPEQGGAIGWLQRRSGVLGLVAVLLLAGLIGLLVGHWITASNNTGPQNVRITYANAPAAVSTPTPETSSGSTKAKAHAAKPKETAAQEEAKEAQEIKAEEAKAKALPAPVKTNSASQKKLEAATGKKRAELARKQEEENPGAPIESH